MDDEMLKKRRLNCLTNFHNNYMERMVNHYNSMQANGVSHFLYYEPGIMFLGWFSQPQQGMLRFNAKFCDEANTKDNIEQALITYYTRHHARRILVINEFENCVITDPGQEPVVSPLENVISSNGIYLDIKVTTAEIDNKDYKILNFGEGLEEKIFNSD